MLEMHVIVHGAVQGVFFRATTLKFARRLGLVGTVSNLPEGTVEIYAQGSKKALEELLELLQGPEGPGKILRIDKKVGAPTKSFTEFLIC